MCKKFSLIIDFFQANKRATTIFGWKYTWNHKEERNNFKLKLNT